jgi:glycosyltransferase involved in cell wall biosynthesis
MVREKNARFIIEAVSRLSEPRPPLVWIANTATWAYRREMEEFAASRGVRFEIRLQIPDADVVDLLNRAALMLYAPRLEPFGLAPLEASACGLPVVAVAEGGVRETIVDGVNGLLVDGDPGSMAAAAQRLLADAGHARVLGKAGTRLVKERWSLAAAHARLAQQLEELVPSSRG